ncbi:response regulator transcription factor [bacterium]|nr:response regulator transcription factor [bacterium]
MPKTIYLADDHKIFRDALKPLLDRQPDLEVAGEGADGLAAVRDVRRLKPDFVLIDLSMPGLNGIEATRQILAERPEIRVLVLSMHADRRFVTEALKAGAVGYVLKESSFDELIHALQEVRAGRMYLSPSISDLVLKEFVDRVREDEESAYTVLSAREREVLQLLAEGSSTKEMAEKLNVSVKTIETHRVQIKNKLNLNSIAELTKYAIREGLTRLDG